MKLIAVVIFTLICSTVAEDENKNKKNSSRESQAGKHSEGSNESGEKNSKETKCSAQIKYSYNPKYGCYLYKEKDHTVVILGYITYSVVFLDGQTGDVFVLVNKESSLVYIAPDDSDKTWIAKKQPFAEYVKNFNSPYDLYKLGEKKGIKFTAETIPDNVQKKLAKILLSQSPAYKDDCKAFGYAMEILKLTQIGRINGFEHVLDKPLDNVDLKGDLQSVGVYYRGWRSFFGDFKGEMEILKQKKIKLDYKKLLESATEFHLLVYFLTAVAPHCDLVNIIQKRLNVDWKFFQLVGKLGGGVNYGFGGFLQLVSVSVSYLNGKISEKDVELVVKEYFINDRAVQDDYQKKWKTSISFVVTSIKELKLDGRLGNIFTILKGIEKDKWNIDGVDLCAFLKTVWDEKLPGNEDSIKKVLNALTSKKDKKD